MKPDESNKQDDEQNASAERDCPDSAGSGYYLDGFPEPEVAYTRSKALSGSFECRCIKGAWCYAKGGERPCDAGLLIPKHIQNDKDRHA